MEHVRVTVHVDAPDLTIELQPPPDPSMPSAQWMKKLARLLAPRAGMQNVFSCSLTGTLVEVADHLWRHQILWIRLVEHQGAKGAEQHVAVHLSELLDMSADFSGERYAHKVVLDEEETTKGSHSLTVGLELELFKTCSATHGRQQVPTPKAYVLRLKAAESESTEKLSSHSGRLARLRCGSVEKPLDQGIRHTLVLVDGWPEVALALADIDACIQFPCSDDTAMEGDYEEVRVDLSQLALVAKAPGGTDTITAWARSGAIPSCCSSDGGSRQSLTLAASVQVLCWLPGQSATPGLSKDMTELLESGGSDLHRWRLSVDIRSMRLVLQTANVFVAYDHAPLLQKHRFRSSPAVLARKNTTLHLPHAFASHTLTGTEEEIRARLAEPLCIEVWQRDLYKQNALLGFVEAGIELVWDQSLQYSASLPSMVSGYRVLDRLYDIVGGNGPEPERMGALRVLLFLEDLGPVKATSALPALPTSGQQQQQRQQQHGQGPLDSRLPEDTCVACSAETTAPQAPDLALDARCNPYELHLWRRAEEAKFQAFLAEEEATMQARLQEGHRKKEHERCLEFGRRLGQLQEVDVQVRGKLHELLQREVGVVAEETRLMTLCDEVKRRTELAAREHEDIARQSLAEAQAKLCLAQKQNEALEGRLSELRGKLLAIRAQATSLDLEMAALHAQSKSSPLAQVQVELQAERMRLQQQQQRVAAIASLREQFRKKTEDLCQRARPQTAVFPSVPCQTSLPPKGCNFDESKSAKNEFNSEEVKEALAKIRADVGKLAHDLTVADSPLLSGQGALLPEDVEAVKHLAWLQNQRNEILSSGMYSERDPVVLAIDANILEARARCWHVAKR